MRKLYVVGRKPISNLRDFKIIYSDSGYKVIEHRTSPGNLHLLNRIKQEGLSTFIGWFRKDSKEKALLSFNLALRRLLGLRCDHLDFSDK